MGTRRSAPGVQARHAEWSLITSADDLIPRPTPELLEIAVAAIGDALRTPLTDLPGRCTGLDLTYARTWPGEHYRLLPAMARAAPAGRVVEVGTFTGMGTVALLESGAQVTTYDLIPWNEFPHTVLTEADFVSAEQRLGDLSDPGFFYAQTELLSEAGLIFVDGPKDGRFESAFSGLLREAFEGSGKLLVYDDIRVMTMIQFWRDLPLPKLDVTSFGHWAGTGLVLL
jgi:hypothetical protein